MKKQVKKYVETEIATDADVAANAVSRPSKKFKEPEAVLATFPVPKPVDFEMFILAKACQPLDLKFDYCGIEVTLSKNDWNEIGLVWKDDEVEDKLFQQAWDIARNPLHGVPRPFRQDAAAVPMRFDEFDAKNYTHEEVRRAIRYSHEWPHWLREFDKVKEAYDKLAKKSPLIGLKWAESRMQKAAPWCTHKDLTARVVAALNAMDFLPYAGIVSYTERFGKDPFFEYAVGHEKGYPIVWRQERTWSTDGETVLDSIKIQLHADGFRVIVGGGRYPKIYAVKTGEECAEMLTELPFRIQKVWLDSLDRKFAGTYTVNTLTGLAAVRNKETFDTAIFVVSGDPGPGHYNFDKTFEPTDHNFLGMYVTAENNLKGGK